MLRQTLPRLTAALCLGVLAGILALTLHGAALVHGARLDQAARSRRLQELGAVAVPSPALLASLTWRDDLAAGLFYGLAAGWPLGGLAGLAAFAFMERKRRWPWAALAGSLAVVALGATLEPGEDPVRARSRLPGRVALAQLDVRDRILLNHGWGRAFTAGYYRWAPLAQLPIGLPEERLQKLAAVLVQGPEDLSGLPALGYQPDRCASIAELEDRLAGARPELAVVQADGETLRRLARSHPDTLVLGIPLPLTEPRALVEALDRGWSEAPEPHVLLRSLIRLGASPPFLAAGLLLTFLLPAGTALVLAPPRRRIWIGAGFLALLAWLGMGAAGDLRVPSQGILSVRERALARPGVPLPSEDIDFLAAQLGAGDDCLAREAARAWALAALARPGDARRMEVLLQAVALKPGEDPEDPRRRQWAALALGFCGDRDAVPALLAALKDPALLVRDKAASALGELGDPAAVGPLMETVREDAWYVAQQARKALHRMGR